MRRWYYLLPRCHSFSLPFWCFLPLASPRARWLNRLYRTVDRPNAAQGVGARNAFDLAIREANASGKFPFKLEMVALDDASDPATGVAAALKLVSDSAVVAASGTGTARSPWPPFTPSTLTKYPLFVWGAIHPTITASINTGVQPGGPDTGAGKNNPLCDWVIGELGTRPSASSPTRALMAKRT